MRRELTERLSRPGLRLGNLKLGSKIALAVVALIVLMAIFAPLITQYGPLTTGTPSTSPDGNHWFGTDAIGRDIFSRVAYGARASLLIGLCATGLALVAAAILGSIAATAGKWVSEVLMRILDIIMSFPGIALAAVFVAVWGSSTPVLILAIAFLYTPQLTRVVRANVLAQFGEDYVSASKVMGSGTPRILIKHVARNCLAPILVFATVLVADAIVFEASLSFINAGVKPPDPSWGNVLADGKQLLLNGGWWATFFPGLMILITVLALNVLSEGMTDAMVSLKARPVKLKDAVEDSEEPAVAALAAAANTPTIALEDRLAALRSVESARTDRLVSMTDEPPVLEVKDLCIRFPEQHGDVDVVDHVSFSVRPGETMGLVGESGCGKSITSMSIMGLLPPNAQITGQILYEGRDLLALSPKEHNALRGHEIAMIYQDALSSLNPSMLISAQMKQLTKRGGKRSAEELLELVGLDPQRTLKSYPHELSGGQRQRVLIAMALTRNPKLVIADEPTTALDVTVQKQVVALLNKLREELGFAMVFVSHDLALVPQVAHRITVMYAGQVVESGQTSQLLTDPRHEYTRGLLGAVLSIESGVGRLHQVPGVVPSPREFVAGDRFAPRSSHPTVGLDRRPPMQTVPGTDHRWAAFDADNAQEMEVTR
ncbi:dipeptide/oligopeptide/nickel ABC transporter permease/ATP-binding protein [Calidifontibacter indicus]|uniref:Peptide/nickel transport system permease protein n=1 Tax=Calidifontibacter indicus TaxID=419650 RepID=A0A3D9UUA2_9MICO|nr:dipeptide/oligopeptide/nickel ABC transporter permease/ATP-binding protein [Calidifontibacter indicus]REF29584.1 peptide/nickel transport system permease protein [Calidifontibacter indicus]